MDLSNPEVAEKCNYLLDLFNISNDDLFVHWEAFKYQSGQNPNEKPNIDLLNQLQQYIQQSISKQKNNNDDSKYSVKKRKLNSTSTTTTTTTATSDIKISESFNNNIQSKPTTILNKSFKIIGDFTPQKYNYKTMNLKLLEIADYIDDRINQFTNLFIENNILTPDQLGNPSLQSQSEIFTIGRIVPDSPLSTSMELNIDSLFLETSRSHGFGYRIPLNLSNIKSESFFSGQIVCFKGINSSGNEFKVLQNLHPPYLGATSFTESEIQQFSDTIGDDNLKLALLSGPFHSRNSLDFTKLEKIINHLNDIIKPDLVIISGPFIDSSALPQIIPNLLSNSNDDNSDLRTIDDIYLAYVQPLLSNINANKKIIIPHSNDASFSPHTSYPQPRFDRRSLMLDKSFKCFPNPSIFSINELTIGISTADILRDLKDVTTIDAPNSRIDRVVNHLITQRSFYPLQTSNSAQIDTSFLGLAEFDTALPDLLILPSVVTPFARCVKNVLVINPGSIVHGSFALVQVKRPDLADMDIVPTETIDSTFIASAWKRTRVDLFNC